MKTYYILVVLVSVQILLWTLPVHSCSRKKPGKPVSDDAPAPPEDLNFKCKDESGRSINWFIAYKLAKIKESVNPLVKSGLGYAFIQNSSPDKKWHLSERSIGDRDSIIGRSLNPLFVSHEGFGKNKLFILYNDQPPNRTAVSYNGHTKGLIIASAKGGIWLQHSVPRFPQTNASHYVYPASGENNGQMFFCISLTPDNIEKIGDTLLHTKPIVFEYAIPNGLRSLYPNLVKIVEKKRNSKLATSNIFLLNEHGLNLTIFAKGPKYEKDIYSDWIAPKLQSNLKVQSWLNGANSMFSNCTQKYQILNISEKKLERHAFSTRKDHSKWAISDEGKWTCISDLNRMVSNLFMLNFKL
ncbi:unnamed protein product [Allacma fusca]|uniref:Uncharacterized protein n=1 Tax=Allacma fusca TaxID=39272 RepID=A0A8J2PF38_9HEXA|nr:unnamed protein product [Allacma fusca]